MNNNACKACGGSGFRTEEREGRLFAVPCGCRVPARKGEFGKRAGIPHRYEGYVFEAFKPATPSQTEALALCRRYADEYPVFGEGANGLLFLGPCGVGKTHLAVAILMQVVWEKGMPALFVDLNDLYREIRSTYGKFDSPETEYDILSPVVEAPLLLIDELGCVSTPWAQDTLHYLVSQRYNEQRPTLLTTNYPELPQKGEPGLEDRIGTRTRSRLSEMCRTVIMEGPDHRRR